MLVPPTSMPRMVDIVSSYVAECPNKTAKVAHQSGAECCIVNGSAISSSRMLCLLRIHSILGPQLRILQQLRQHHALTLKTVLFS